MPVGGIVLVHDQSSVKKRYLLVIADNIDRSKNRFVRSRAVKFGIFGPKPQSERFSGLNEKWCILE